MHWVLRCPYPLGVFNLLVQVEGHGGTLDGEGNLRMDSFCEDVLGDGFVKGIGVTGEVYEVTYASVESSGCFIHLLE